jgi:hypothetical protein
MKRVLGTIIGMILVLGVAVPSVRADDDEHECSLASLKRSYGYVLTGSIAGDGRVAAVGLTTFDGRGRLTARDTVSINGAISRGRTGTGSYTVNPNCTGSAIVGGAFSGLTFDFMIVPGTDGRELSFIVTNVGTVQTGVAMRTGDKECTLRSLQGTYRVLVSDGTNAQGQRTAVVGFRVYDGAGNLVAAEDTRTADGVFQHAIGPLAAYTVTPECTVEYLQTDGLLFDGVIVAGGDEAYFVNTRRGTITVPLLKKQSGDHQDSRDD